ncbi:hypothetical protein MRB53_014123 [Persea americana]|uniref:Uncharacterized protein n=1 Tax=Persea americana TaxID=3435 RepID=A0ACC2KA13_PERAE|nr:hypothetical protein MRB53_014123 [Persea americana]
MEIKMPRRVCAEPLRRGWILRGAFGCVRSPPLDHGKERAEEEKVLARLSLIVQQRVSWSKMDCYRLRPQGLGLSKEKHPSKASVPRLKKLTQYHRGPGEMGSPRSDGIPS